MKTTTVYKCDVCGTEYATEENCKKCEDKHKVGYKNAELDKYSRMRAYPDSVTVQFEDDPDDVFVVYSFRNAYTYKNHKDENTSPVEEEPIEVIDNG